MSKKHKKKKSYDLEPYPITPSGKRKKKKKKKKGGKEKKKQDLMDLKVLDMKMDKIHEAMMDDLIEMKKYYKKKQRKINQKAEKLARNGIFGMVNPMSELEEARINIANAMERTNLLDVAFQVLKGVYPMIITIARLIASLILLIFQLPDILRCRIKDGTWLKLNKVYQIAMSIK